jgi:5'-methylthioadenosine phosphorylase
VSIQIGIIGGSGLYDMAELTDREERRLSTPFGNPSGPYVIGTLRGKRVAFLARHGDGHRVLPSELNFRANIYGFKVLGVDWILSASAVGSLKEAVPPARPRVSRPVHRSHVRPAQHVLRQGHRGARRLRAPVLPGTVGPRGGCADGLGATVHRGGTYVCMEGPQFSTLAESNLYRSWGADIIGMTNLQEAKLAREAEICYTTMALVTDYDCWHPDHDHVTVEMIIGNLTQNAKTAQR